MLNKLLDLAEHGQEFDFVKSVILDVQNLLVNFEQQWIREDAYSAAIDAVCEILQTHKFKHEKNLKG